jgi:hypothetical protein
MRTPGVAFGYFNPTAAAVMRVGALSSGPVQTRLQSREIVQRRISITPRRIRKFDDFPESERGL